MDSFLVSARKYRPQKFNAVVGQSHITSTLKNAILNHQLAQAYLFCGPRGVGKTTCARIFAKTINCTSLTPDGEACDQCPSCVSFNSGAALNVYELDAASNNSVDDIRVLVDQVRIAPQLGDYKVYVIDEVHMLSTAAFNAFLKTLEEPPRHAKFILATTEKHKIIPTILSRCQVFNFNRIRTEDIAGYLAWLAKEEGVNYEQEALNVIAQKADGGLRDACSIFDQMAAFTSRSLTYAAVVENLHVLDYDYYFRLVDLFFKGDVAGTMLIFDEILRKGFDPHNFILGLGEHFRNVMMSKDPQTTVLLEVSDSLRQRYARQAQESPVSFLMNALKLIGRADVNFRSARNQRLLVETTLLQLAQLMAPAEAEKKNNESADPVPVAAVPPKPAVIEEPEPQFARRPSVSFEQLKIKTSFSLTSALTSAATTVQETMAPVAAEDVVTIARELTEAEVSAAIQQYAQEKLKSGSRQLGASLTSAAVKVADNVLLVTLSNESQREMLQAVKQDFVDFLRRVLTAPALQCELAVDQVTAPARAWKPSDIFRDMAARNPALLELKRRFDLEIDY